MRTLLLLALIAFSGMVTHADTLYVAAIAEPGGDGQTWGTAYRSLQSGLDAWKPGDEIWIARGTYIAPTEGYSVPNGLHFYGGFEGSETLREERDWFRNRSILASEGGEFILRAVQCDSTTRLDGLVLQGAQNCALRIEGGQPRLFNCHFRENTTTSSGAAIRAEGVGRIRIEYCVFERNRATVGGGAIHIQSDSVDPKGFGPFIGQCHFVNNTADMGGALWLDSCKGVTQVVSTVFAGNTAGKHGGAIESLRSFLYLNNATFSRNTLGDNNHAMGLSVVVNGGFIQNSIFWNGNEDDTVAHITLKKDEADTSSFATSACLVERDYDLGFWQTDPRFENADNVNGADGFFGTDDDGLVLSGFSAARNAGVIDKFVNHRQQDILGNPRLVGRRVDLGAYESQRTGRPHYTDLLSEMRKGKLVFMFRHGKTDWDQKDPGPSPECFPGRNLIAEGREQCTSIGAYQRMLGVPQGDALSSTACRCWETLQKMVGRYETKSHWASGGNASATAARLVDLETVPTNGNRIISTHDAVATLVFNPNGDGEIFTTAELMEGDALIVRPLGDTMEVIGHWCSDTWERYKVRFPAISTSVSEFSQQQQVLSISPVPASDYIAISAGTATAVRVVDILGRVVGEANLVGSGVPATLNTASWNPGIYSVVAPGYWGRVVIAR